MQHSFKKFGQKLAALFFFWYLVTGSVASATTITYGFADNFETPTYGNNDGNASFSTDWNEIGDDNNPESGYIQIESSELYFDWIWGETISRALDLTGSESVELTFDLVANNLVGGIQNVQMLDDGNSWVTILTINNTTSLGELTYTLAPQFRHASSAIRFVAESNWNIGTNLRLDNLLFIATYTDTDGDTVPDETDIDDDNDGILDDDEISPMDGTSPETAFDSLGQARFISNAGVYYFNISGVAFSTYVDSNGYVLVAHDFGNGVDNLPQSLSLSTSARGILSSAALSTLIDANKLRLSYSGGTLDATSTNATLLQRVRDNEVLHEGSADNLLHDGWSGIGSGMLIGNASCTSPHGGQLHQNIFHGCGNASLFHWIPSNDTQRVPWSAGEISAANSISLWVQADKILLDTDADGISNQFDLDSDNDGIPDNVEAQTTELYSAPNGDAGPLNDGLDSAYGAGLTPEHSDSDGIPDYLDNNSDDDNITDCEEGLPANTTDKNCTVNTVEGNGLVDWAGGVADYSDVNGIVDTPLSDLQNILDTTAPEDEVDYRQFNTCGPSTLGLTTFQWKIISFGCDTGTNNIDMLLGNSLGAYGTNWVMYEQDTENGTTGQLRMEDTDKVRPGKGYWIIADQDVNMTVDLGATDDIIKKTEVEAKGNYGITTGTAFDEVMQYTLLNSQTDKKTKVMLGNPFHKKFELSDMYYNSGNNVPSTYYPMDDTDNIGAYVEYTVYAHDSANTSSSNDEYIAITPGTPGMSSPIEPMIGFFLLMRVDPDMGSNSVVFPLEK